MKDLVSSGKIRMLGVCNVTGWQLQKIVMTAKAMGVPMVSLQTQYSLMCREPELELLDCAINEELGWLCTFGTGFVRLELASSSFHFSNQIGTGTL